MRLSVSRQKLLDLLCIPCLFLFVYGIQFKFLPVNTSKIMLGFMLPALMLLILNAAPKYSVKRWLFTSCTILIFMVFISSCYVLLHGTGDFAIAYTYLIMLVETLVGSVGFYYIFLRDKDLSFLCHCIVVITVMQSLIILLMFVSPEIRDMVLLFTKRGETDVSIFLRYGGFRGLGLASSTTHPLAVFLSIGMILASYMIIAKCQSILFYSFAWLINFIAVMMTGRSGLVGVGISLLIFVYAFRKISALKGMIAFMSRILLISVAMIACLLIIVPKDIIVLFNDKVISFAFQMFINYSETGRFETSSSNTTLKMYFPVSLKTFLIGDGYYRSPTDPSSYYMDTDVGYMRHVLYYGIFPSLILYCSYAVGFLSMAQKMRYDKLFAAIILMIGGYFFLVHGKSDQLTGAAMNIKFFFILFVYIFSSNKLNVYGKKNKTLMKGNYISYEENSLSSIPS